MNKKSSPKFLMMFWILMSLSTWARAADVTPAMALGKYKERDATPLGLQRAKEAADLFHQLYALSQSQGKPPLEQARFLIAESKAIYFYADNSSGTEEKRQGHLRGWERGKQAAALLANPQNPAAPTQPQLAPVLALAYYWQGANMGKWGLATGILNSLGKWPELKQTMEHILSMGQRSVEYYGANRILGRSYFKLPFPLGNRDKSLQLLEEANQKTVGPVGGISAHSTNVLYLAEVLIAKGEKERARTLLEKLIRIGNNPAELRKYNADRVPETRIDIAEAKKILQNI